MKTYRLFAVLTVALVVIGAAASETVIKNSVPFSFPLTVGTMSDKKIFAGRVRLGAVYRAKGGKSLDLSWSFPHNGKSGTITLFSLKGATIRTVPITAPSGSIRLNMPEMRLAKGIYFLRLSSASVNINHKIVIY